MDKKTEKKRAKIQERIKELESMVHLALKKKDSKTAEINLPKVQTELANLRSQLAVLK